MCSFLQVMSGLVVYPAVINKRIAQEFPFMALSLSLYVRPSFPTRQNPGTNPSYRSESIFMALSELGISRQQAHEEICVLSHQAAAAWKAKTMTSLTVFGKRNSLSRSSDSWRSCWSRKTSMEERPNRWKIHRIWW